MELLQHGHGLVRWGVLATGALGLFTIWRRSEASRSGGKRVEGTRPWMVATLLAPLVLVGIGLLFL